ncbi:MAG: ABC transporter ATP-binding protein [Victivallaceae bacterium]|nr:ABC transporter ATP-binding protein [Victivallaceae bacterium]
MLKYLKSGLSRRLPADHFNGHTEYGRLRDNVKYLFPSVRKTWRVGVATGFFLLISSLLSWPMPMIFRYLIDNVLLKKNFSLILPVAGIFVAFGIAVFIADMLRNFFESKFAEETILDLRERLLTKTFSLPKTFFDKNQSGYIASRISTDVQGVRFFISGTVTRLFVEAMHLLGGTIFLFYLEWRLALPVAAVLPLSFVLTRFFARKNYAVSHESSELNARLDAAYVESAANVQLIKSFAGEKKMVAGIIELAENKIKILYENITLYALSNGINKLMPSLAKLAVLITGSYWVISGRWEVGTLIAYLAYLSYVYNPVAQLSSSVNQLQSARATLDRIATIFNMAPEQNIDNGKTVGKLNGKIAFENVSFYYEREALILDDVSFVADRGDVWAVVGKSGIGKTTLISLIMRFYRPQKGRIFFDDTDVSELNARSLRKRIGYVSQNIQLLSGSIIDNLKYGNPDAGTAEIVAACKAARIHDFIEELPGKYETIIGERGINLSEGQKQRLALARTLIQNGDIIILDEPTSALDRETENFVCEAFRRHFQGKTAFLIAHRAETIKVADKVILLREGLSPRIGTMEELKNEPEMKKILD